MACGGSALFGSTRHTLVTGSSGLGLLVTYATPLPSTATDPPRLPSISKDRAVALFGSMTHNFLSEITAPVSGSNVRTSVVWYAVPSGATVGPTTSTPWRKIEVAVGVGVLASTRHTVVFSSGS